MLDMAYADPLDPRARAARRKHYEQNKQQYLDRNAAAKAAKVQWLREQKAVPCADCGQSYPHYVMEFHHLDPTEKDRAVTMLVSYGWRRLKAELAKCVVLCANCHRERTYGPECDTAPQETC